MISFKVVNEEKIAFNIAFSDSTRLTVLRGLKILSDLKAPKLDS